MVSFPRLLISRSNEALIHKGFASNWLGTLTRTLKRFSHCVLQGWLSAVERCAAVFFNDDVTYVHLQFRVTKFYRTVIPIPRYFATFGSVVSLRGSTRTPFLWNKDVLLVRHFCTDRKYYYVIACVNIILKCCYLLLYYNDTIIYYYLLLCYNNTIIYYYIIIILLFTIILQ